MLVFVNRPLRRKPWRQLHQHVHLVALSVSERGCSFARQRLVLLVTRPPRHRPRPPRHRPRLPPPRHLDGGPCFACAWAWSHRDLYFRMCVREVREWCCVSKYMSLNVVLNMFVDSCVFIRVRVCVRTDIPSWTRQR